MVCRAPDARRPAIQYVGVDHGRADIAMTEQLLNGSDIAIVLEQVGREGVTQRVAGCALLDTHAQHCVPDGTL